MSYFSKAVAVVAVLFLGVLTWQILPGGPGDKHDQAAARAEDPPADAPAEPHASPGRRSADVPLQHAILRDEKDDDSAETQILKLLAKPTTVEFIDLPLEDCITYLKEYHGINIWLDKTTLIDEGVALDQPMNLQLAGVTLRSVLKLLLEPLQLTYVIEDEVMKITTSTKAGEKLTTRVYPVGDLVIPIINARMLSRFGGMGMMGRGMGMGMMGNGMGGMGGMGGMMGGMGRGMGMGMFNVHDESSPRVNPVKADPR